MKAEETRFTIAYKVIELEVRDGHLQWRVSDLAKLSGVSRTLIYYHLGSTKAAILKHSIALICEDYYALSGPRSEMAKNGNLLESLLATREILDNHPSLSVFYQRCRFENSPSSLQLQDIERRYQKKLHAALPHLNETQVVALHAQLHGLITAPFLETAHLRKGFTDLSETYRLEKNAL